MQFSLNHGASTKNLALCSITSFTKKELLLSETCYVFCCISWNTNILNKFPSSDSTVKKYLMPFHKHFMFPRFTLTYRFFNSSTTKRWATRNKASELRIIVSSWKFHFFSGRAFRNIFAILFAKINFGFLSSLHSDWWIPTHNFIKESNQI